MHPGEEKLGACTRKMNKIKSLLVLGGNVDTIDEDVATFKSSLKEFEEILANVQRSDEIMEHERINWYEPKMSIFRNFLWNGCGNLEKNRPSMEYFFRSHRDSQ